MLSAKRRESGRGSWRMVALVVGEEEAGVDGITGADLVADMEEGSRDDNEVVVIIDLYSHQTFVKRKEARQRNA